MTWGHLAGAFAAGQGIATTREGQGQHVLHLWFVARFRIQQAPNMPAQDQSQLFERGSGRKGEGKLCARKPELQEPPQHVPFHGSYKSMQC